MVWTGLAKYRDLGLLLLRVGLGLSMIAHGYPKLFGGPTMWTQVGSAMGTFGIDAGHTAFGLVAGLIEFGGGILLLAGLLFRVACILLVLQMLVAMSQHLYNPHFPEVLRGFSAGWSHPMEMAIVFFGLIFIGPGRFSMDRK